MPHGVSYFFIFAAANFLRLLKSLRYLFQKFSKLAP